MRRLLGLTFLLTLLGSAAIAQSTQPAPTPESTPSSKPPVKRRGLDQFGLSGGIFNSTPSDSPNTSEGSPMVAEPVDRRLRDLLSSVRDHLVGVESGYRLAYEKRKEPRYASLMPERYVFDHISESHASPVALRDGLFEGKPFKEPRNAALFTDIRTTIDDLVLTTSRLQRDESIYSGEFRALVNKYTVPTSQAPTGQAWFQTRDLVQAIFARAIDNLTKLEKQIVSR